MLRLSGAVRAAVALCVLALSACDRDDTPRHLQVAGGDPGRGRLAVERHGCIACHAIPGFSDVRTGSVGPSLHGIAARGYIAGILPNWPQNMVSWLIDPPAHAPRTAMPDLGVTVAEARDIAAYLYSFGGPRDQVYPPEPRLMPASLAERRRAEAAARAALEEYGWSDADARLARIPIERTIELLESGVLSLEESPSAPGRAPAGGDR